MQDRVKTGQLSNWVEKMDDNEYNYVEEEVKGFSVTSGGNERSTTATEYAGQNSAETLTYEPGPEASEQPSGESRYPLRSLSLLIAMDW